MAQAIADLEAVREYARVASWLVLGHSWGSDLAVRYAFDHPDRVTAVVGVAGKGLHKDRSWSEAYEAAKERETPVRVEFVEEVWTSLRGDFDEWIHQPVLWRRLADSTVPMWFLAAGDDIRPNWPLRQLAALVPQASLEVVPGVPHDFWFNHPEIWQETVTRACRAASVGR